MAYIYIPKIIHYCWFGRNPLPELAVKCIESWKKYFQEYEIKEWNEDNFDINIIPYTAEAYRLKKYAFVSDYARFWVLYHYGGLYFDTDVEVIRPMDDIIERGPFMGCEMPVRSNRTMVSVAPGLGLGVNPGFGLYKELLDEYSNREFVFSGKIITVVDITTNVLVRHGLKNTNEIQNIAGCYIYPVDYFNPRDIITKRMKLTINTRSIHHYMASWSDERKCMLKEYIRKYIPESLLFLYNRVKSYFLSV